MMISEEQRNSIKQWLEAGASLADVQKNLKEEYQLTMTYMDVRLLVIEIGAEVQEEPEPEPKPEKLEPPPSAADANTAAPRPGPWKAATGAEDVPEAENSEQPDVSLSIDRLVVPGAMVSGDVTFTDGVKAHWVIDQAGRFGLEPDVKGYHPTDLDLQMFQTKLRAELQRKGYA